MMSAGASTKAPAQKTSGASSSHPTRPGDRRGPAVALKLVAS